MVLNRIYRQERHLSCRTSLSLSLKSYHEDASPNGKQRVFFISCNKKNVYIHS